MEIDIKEFTVDFTVQEAFELLKVRKRKSKYGEDTGLICPFCSRLSLEPRLNGDYATVGFICPNCGWEINKKKKMSNGNYYEHYSVNFQRDGKEREEVYKCSPILCRGRPRK